MSCTPNVGRHPAFGVFFCLDARSLVSRVNVFIEKRSILNEIIGQLTKLVGLHQCRTTG
ncbi:hypothetical protein PSAC2689_20163 [Paraburkholderia sacchari]